MTDHELWPLYVHRTELQQMQHILARCCWCALKNYPVAFFVFLILILPMVRTVGAAEMVFQETYYYKAGEADSKLSCRTISLLQLKKSLLEKVGTHIRSTTRINDFQLVQDEVTAISAAVVKTEILEEKWDGSTYSMTARIVVDPMELFKSIEKIHQDPEATEEIKKCSQIESKAMNDMFMMQLNLSRLQNDLVKISHDYKGSKKIIDAWGTYERGVESHMEGNYQKSLAAFDVAIKANPDPLAYFERGKGHIEISCSNKPSEQG